MKKTRLSFFNTDSDFVKNASQHIFELIQQSPQQEVLLSLSGGKTPYPVYFSLANRLIKAGLQEKAFFVQTDERMVPRESLSSNQNLIKKSLFSKPGISKAHFAAIDPEREDQAESFSACLNGLPAKLLPPRPIDILILGMGSDGHTASLFPGTSWLSSSSSTGYSVFAPPDKPEKRISLNLDRLLTARNIVFLVSGKDKSEALTEVLIKKNIRLPAAYVNEHCDTHWFFTPEAALSWPEGRKITGQS
jgi:6-phosphogluconolactonase